MSLSPHCEAGTLGSTSRRVRWAEGGLLPAQCLAAAPPAELQGCLKAEGCAEEGRIPRVSFLVSQDSTRGIIKTNRMPKLKSEHMLVGVVGNAGVTAASF